MKNAPEPVNGLRRFLKKGEMMKFKYRFQEAVRFFKLAFYPMRPILIYLSVTVVLDILLGIGMARGFGGDAGYNVLFAMLTGITASFFVSAVTELSNNYKNNLLAWHELEDYYRVIVDFVMNKGILQRKDWDDGPRDEVQAVWALLPKIIPVLEKTYQEKKAFLNEKEIFELGVLLEQYQIIRSEVARIVKRTYYYDTMNRPDEAVLQGEYPQNILDTMPDWLKKHLACEESKAAMEKLVDKIMADEFLLNSMLKDYDISEKALTELSDEEEEESENITENAENAEEEDGEWEEEPEMTPEEHRAMCEQMNRELEEQYRPAVSQTISECCKQIAAELRALEEQVSKKPAYGTYLQVHYRIQQRRNDETER